MAFFPSSGRPRSRGRDRADGGTWMDGGRFDAAHWGGRAAVAFDGRAAARCRLPVWMNASMARGTSATRSAPAVGPATQQGIDEVGEQRLGLGVAEDGGAPANGQTDR